MARLPDNKQRRLEGLNQDVLAVAAPSPVPLLQPVVSSTDQARHPQDRQPGKSAWPLWLALAVALFAFFIAALAGMQNRHLAKQLAVLQQQQKESSKELAELMELPVVGKPAADSKSNVSGTAWRAALLQINKRLRALDIEQNKLQGKLGGGSDMEARLASLNNRVQQLGAQLESLSAAPPPASAAPSAPDNSAELDKLKAKVNHMDKDLQSLYRILQGR
ncbi:MAG: hypothetical protein R3292_07270 [Alcanivorax sp.]|nr:hypothetical protein [Alcanivorax sp.]